MNKERHDSASKDTSCKSHLLTHPWPEFYHVARLSCKRVCEIFISSNLHFRWPRLEVNRNVYLTHLMAICTLAPCGSLGTP